MKPTKEEIQKWFLINLSLQTIGEDEQGNDVLLAEDDSLIDAICALNEKAMQEYANLFHKEKLREELIKFQTYCNEEQVLYVSDFIIDEYLKTLNTK